MKALVKQEAKEGLWLKDMPEPEMGINDVLIKVKRTAICGTDLHIYNWDSWAQKTIPVPMIVGTWVGLGIGVVLGVCLDIWRACIKKFKKSSLQE